MGRTRAGLLAGAARAFAEHGLRAQHDAVDRRRGRRREGDALQPLPDQGRGRRGAAGRRARPADRAGRRPARCEQALAALSDELGAHPVLRRLAETEPETLTALLAVGRRALGRADRAAGRGPAAWTTTARSWPARWLLGVVLQPGRSTTRHRHAGRLAAVAGLSRQPSGSDRVSTHPVGARPGVVCVTGAAVAPNRRGSASAAASSGPGDRLHGPRAGARRQAGEPLHSRRADAAAAPVRHARRAAWTTAEPVGADDARAGSRVLARRACGRPRRSRRAGGRRAGRAGRDRGSSRPIRPRTPVGGAEQPRPAARSRTARRSRPGEVVRSSPCRRGRRRAPRGWAGRRRPGCSSGRRPARRRPPARSRSLVGQGLERGPVGDAGRRAAR